MQGGEPLIWTVKVVLLASLAACATQDAGQRHEALMASIERSVVLPKGTQPLKAYGRAYAFAGQDRVIASYFIPIEAPDVPCRAVMPGNSSRPCTAEEAARDDQIPAGTRRWYDKADLPRRLWAGCEQVNVVYEISSHRIIDAACDTDH